jgi:hypothetical protein
MFPPMYFTLQSALGLSGPSSEHNDPAELRNFILKRSEFKEENRELWKAFIKEHPSDGTGKFIAAVLDVT